MSDEEIRKLEVEALQGGNPVALERYVRARVRTEPRPRRCFWCSEVISTRTEEEFWAHQKACLPPRFRRTDRERPLVPADISGGTEGSTGPGGALQIVGGAPRSTGSRVVPIPPVGRISALARKVVLRTPFVIDGKGSYTKILDLYDGVYAGHEFWFYGPTVILDAGQPIKDVNAAWNQTVFRFLVSTSCLFSWPLSILTPGQDQGGVEGESAPERSVTVGAEPVHLRMREAFALEIGPDPLRGASQPHEPVRGTFLMFGIQLRGVN